MLQNIVTILFLVFMEGLLSFDNALALAAMVRHLPDKYQKKALTYGMAGAFGFRFLALFCLTLIMQSVWVKFLGGGYLIGLAVKHFVSKEEDNEKPKEISAVSFWKTIVLVELTDISFSIDSILASVAVSDKLWIIVTGGVLGIIMMRFASMVFIRLMEIFPKLERTAYLLIFVVGSKLVLEGLRVPGIDFHHGPALLVFWTIMAACVVSGLFGRSGPQLANR